MKLDKDYGKQKHYNLGGQIVKAKAFKQYVIAYQKSDKGKLTIARWKEKNKDGIRRYMQEYNQAQKERCKVEGICTTCKTRPAENGLVSCSRCREKKIKYLRDRSKR
jgi:hypothetical protein